MLVLLRLSLIAVEGCARATRQLLVLDVFAHCEAELWGDVPRLQRWQQTQHGRPFAAHLELGRPLQLAQLALKVFAPSNLLVWLV